MMIQDDWWILHIDHRISTAIILFALLLLLGNRQRRPGFALRAALALLSMCAVSWLMRFALESMQLSPIAQGIGYSLHLLVMGLMYLWFYHFCYHVSPTDAMYVYMLAIIIYKLAWNTHKTFATAWTTAGAPDMWARYSPLGSLVSYATYGLVCLAACWIYKRLVLEPLTEDSRKPIFTFALAFTLCLMVLECCGHVFSLAVPATFLYYLSMLMYTLLNYVVLITIAQLVYYRRSSEDMEQFIANKMQYYEMSRDGILSLQIKCHDLKHQIAAIRSEAGKADFEKYITRLEDSIIEYGTVIECGNEIVNVVLTEKNILCTTYGIKFSYLIDGSLFDFMTEMELYSLFGNTLDNALESCNKVRDPGKRMISLKASARGELVVLHVENYFDEQPKIVDGVPVTTKDGSGHGFGLRSIQQITQKYDGVMSVKVEDQIFKLTVLLKPARA